MDNKQSTDFEIGDVESYSSGDSQFSKSMLVMIAFKRAAENASHEMRPGWWNVKTDSSGNTTRTYVEDTRYKFIESVKTLDNLLSPSYDSLAKKKITELKKSLREKKSSLLKSQNEWYQSLDKSQKRIVDSEYGVIQPIALDTRLGWSEVYSQFQLETWNKIFRQLSKLVDRIQFGAEEVMTG